MSASQLALLNSVRFAVQKVCLPIILAIGIPGNLFTLVVLSRKHMRTSSTNFYLAALAFADLFYLILHFSLTLQHYPSVRDSQGSVYLKYLVVGYPLTDWFSNVSTWIVVSFTTERFIVIQNPIKGKIWCTIKKAKIVVALVYVCSFLATLPTAFERTVIPVLPKLTELPRGNETSPKALITSMPASIYAIPWVALKQQGNYSTTSRNEISHGGPNGTRNVITLPISITLKDVAYPSSTSPNGNPQSQSSNKRSSKKKYVIVDTALYNNARYQKTYFWFTSVYSCFLPLTLIVIFNSLLIIWIRKSSSIQKNLNSSIWLRKTQSMSRGRGPLTLNRIKPSLNGEQTFSHNIYNNTNISGIGTTSSLIPNSNNANSPKFKKTNKLPINKPNTSISLYNGKKHRLVVPTYNPIQRMSTPKKGESNLISTTSTMSAANQETRITYMLIIVVVVFIFCQLPSALLLLAFLLKPSKQELTMWKLFNNFANLLVAIHACLNFILYCLLSKKFRATFSSIFLSYCGYKDHFHGRSYSYGGYNSTNLISINNNTNKKIKLQKTPSSSPKMSPVSEKCIIYNSLQSKHNINCDILEQL